MINMRRKRKRLSFWGRLEQRKKITEISTSTEESTVSSRTDKKRKLKLRKNFLPTLIAITVLWGSLGMLVYFVDPYKFGSVILFFILLFFATFFTFSMLLANSRRGAIFAVIITLFMFLKYIGVGSLLNLLLLTGLALTLEIYLYRR